MENAFDLQIAPEDGPETCRRKVGLSVSIGLYHGPPFKLGSISSLGFKWFRPKSSVISNNFDY